jgi:hypothetical protein
MRKVVVEKEQLLAILKTNRTSHVVAYEEAVKGYKIEALARLDSVNLKIKEQINSLKQGEFLSHLGFMITVPVPESHEDDYNRAIKMVEMSVDATLEIDEQRFDELVMDNWSWKDKFIASNSSYRATAANFAGQQ